MQIKKYRNLCGFTQKELAKKLGVHQTAVAQWESGRTNPNIHRLSCICGILHCTVKELFDDEQEVGRSVDDDHFRVGSSERPMR